MKKQFLAASALALTLGFIGPASANVIVLNFAGLNGSQREGVGNYYDGGFGSLGSGPGPNYGITFGSDSITCNDITGPNGCNTSQIPGGPGANALFFLGGPGDVMDVAAGFKTGFAFDYSSPFFAGSVTVWSGLDGTGTLLATLLLPQTADGSGTAGCNGANYCPYAATGVSFSGTAESVVFSGVANYIAFADITLGSNHVPVPEPMTLSLFGAGLVAAGVAGRRRRKTNKAA
jgi:hypothetical protein